jgi:hypothetical protein
MRALASLLLALFALSASADCTSRVLLRASAPISVAQVEEGVLYYSLFPQRTVQRFDEVSGTSSLYVNANIPLSDWGIDRGRVVLHMSATEIVLLQPGAAPRVIDEPAAVGGLRVQDGFIYWLQADGSLHRSSIDDGGDITLAVGLPADARYSIFRDRVVFTTTTGVYWQMFGGVPVLLLPRADVTVAALTADAVFVTTSTPFDPNHAAAQLLRVPWSGAPVETIYEYAIDGYAPVVKLSAAVRGDTVYVIRTVTIHFFSTTSTLVVIRNGVARERHAAAIAPIALLDASEDEVTIGEWSDGGGMRLVERLCALAPRGRAVAR